MKKLIPLLTALALGLTACGSGGTATTPDSSTTAESSTDAETTTTEAVTEETKAPSAEETSFAETEETAEQAETDVPWLEDDDFNETFTNYSTEIHINTDGVTMVLTYKVHPDGMFFSTGDESSVMMNMIVSREDNAVYMIDPASKTAMAFVSDAIDDDLQDPVNFFVPWDEDDLPGLKRGSSQTFDGRSVTAYTYEREGYEATYLIDNELGICLAVTWEGNDTTGSWEMHNLEIGQVSADEVKIPADYTITDISGFEDMLDDFDDFGDGTQGDDDNDD